MRQTTEQKETRRLNRVIESARRGQSYMRPGPAGYTESQKTAFAEYQKIIDRCQLRIAVLQKG